MAIVTLHHLWLNLASDTSDYQHFPFQSQMDSTPQTDIQVTLFASGVSKSTRSPGVRQQENFTLTAVTAAQRAWLELHAGELMCVRDDRGRKFYGVYAGGDLDATEHAYNDECDITVTFNEVTHSEAV